MIPSFFFVQYFWIAQLLQLLSCKQFFRVGNGLDVVEHHVSSLLPVQMTACVWSVDMFYIWIRMEEATGMQIYTRTFGPPSSSKWSLVGRDTMITKMMACVFRFIEL